jgi:hypothetical protein
MVVLRLLSCIFLFALLCSCASYSNSVISESQRSRLGVVGVNSISTLPRTDLNIGSVGIGAGVGKGLASGAFSGLAASAFACHDPFCIIFLSPIMVVSGATYGAVIGGINTIPKSKAKEIEDRLKNVLTNVDIQKQLQTEIVDAAKKSDVQNVYLLSLNTQPQLNAKPNNKTLIASSPDTFLEVGVVSVGFVGDGGGENPFLSLQVNTIIKLFDIKSNQVIYHRDSLIKKTAPRKFSEWCDNSAVLLKVELTTTLHELARLIVDEVFLLVRSN